MKDKREPNLLDLLYLAGSIGLSYFTYRSIVAKNAKKESEMGKKWNPADIVLASGSSAFVRYDGAADFTPENEERARSGGLLPGTIALQKHLLSIFPKDIRKIGGFKVRRNTASPEKMSLHSERAIDVYTYSNADDRIANWAIENAANFGIQFVIWRGKYWRGSDGKFADYTGPDPHDDHVHIEQNKDGGEMKTPFFKGGKK